MTGTVGALIDRLHGASARLGEAAAEHDATATFPGAEMALLAEMGLAAAPLPRSAGGLGAGTEPAGAEAILTLLRTLGSLNLSLARLFEAHVNVVRLVTRYGSGIQRQALAEQCRAGSFHGLWVTDAPAQPLCAFDGRLQGTKGPCSGAGHLRHALVTVQHEGATRMVVIALSGAEPVTPVGLRLHGMRASANGTIRLDGIAVPPDGWLGAPGDYLREPDFSTGAWRTMAATLGGMDALLESVRLQLRARGHEALPLQQARFGEMLIARDTARLWTQEAATVAEAGTAPVADQVATVNLARIAVEAACFDLMRHAQRALGLSALVAPNPVERLLRDLGTYLRQPAADLVLIEAAQHALNR